MITICKCPHCNGLYEVGDYDETGAVCQWCGNEIGIAEYVRINDTKELLKNIINDRQLLKDAIALDNTTGFRIVTLMNYIMALGGLIPLGYTIHHWTVGDPVRWYLYLLAGMGIFFSYVVIKMVKSNGKLYKKLKKIVEKHDYSVMALSSEIPALDKIIKEAEESDKISAVDVGDEAVTLKKYIETLIPYVISRAGILEGYSSDTGHKGVKADAVPAAPEVTETPSGAYDNSEPFIYIVPPARCPGCNHPYTAEEKNHGLITCPHCATRIQVVDQHARTEVQAMVRAFLNNVSQSEGFKMSKGMMIAAGIILAILLVVMAVKGIEAFLFGWWAIPWFFTCVMAIMTFYMNKDFLKLRKMTQEGMNDIFELELFVESRAIFMKEEFYELKAKIVSHLNK